MTRPLWRAGSPIRKALKPGNLMPAVKLSPDERARIVAWLRTLN